MKVHIGPYRNYFGPYQLAEKLCFWVKKTPDEYGCLEHPDWVHDFGTLLANGIAYKNGKVCINDEKHSTLLARFLNWVDSKKSRKIKVKIDKFDTWSMDSTLAIIVLPMLRQLHATKHGAPLVDDEDVPAGLGLRESEAPPKEHEWDTDANHFKRWDWVLDEIIWTFEQLHPDSNWEDQYHSGKMDAQFEKIENSDMFRMIAGPQDTHKFDSEGYKAHNDRINAGLILFGKYYRSLWD